MKAYTAGENRLSSAYSFDFLYAPALTAELVARSCAHGPSSRSYWPRPPAEGWPSWAFENHDAPRLSRWVGEEHPPAFARMLLLLLASLRAISSSIRGRSWGWSRTRSRSTC
jgi:alpha-glucosidase